MTDITFNNENNLQYKSRAISDQTEIPGMAKFLINKGIVKNEQQAKGVLLTIIIVFFISSFVLIYLNFFKQPSIPTPSEEDILMQQELTKQQ